MINNVPEKLINFNVYDDGNKLLGVASEVTLPTFDAITETISGAGIAGEVDSPTIGHFGSMTIDIPFRTVTDQAFNLMQPTAQLITLRGSQQSYDVAGGTILKTPVRVVLRTQPKSIDLGTFTVGGPTNTTNTLEVLYIKIVVNDVEVLEYDKYNFIYKVNGVDYLAEVKDQIG